MNKIRETYSLKIAEYIRNLVRSGKLRPGDPVLESSICKKLQVSRSPIREALLILGQQGIISYEPQKHKYIRSMSPKEIYDSYIIAGVLEGVGVAQSIHLWTRKEDENFEKAVEKFNDKADYESHINTFAEVDENFHLTLLSACDNERLVEIARTSCSSLAKFLYYPLWQRLFSPKEFYDRHMLVADAVRSKEPGLIERTLRAHYEEVGKRLSEKVRDSVR
ncbi:GntR family transcriptional regulator [uncultured Mailhella sp.]|uniref:GntR family transcriptional regulator n=1 Tax=uncultured Mailhella sp. TaxID=1981031 RepID=UPI0025CC1E2D|nr:GntR family transcriptional regulator [uncultured Mailhella sp.]